MAYEFCSVLDRGEQACNFILFFGHRHGKIEVSRVEGVFLFEYFILRNLQFYNGENEAFKQTEL